MSHFLVGVFCEDVEDVQELMAPYDEENESCYEFKEEESESLEELRKLYLDENKEGLTFDDWLMSYGGYVLRNGRVGYMVNPNARWDWWVEAEEGRWKGMYKLKLGEKPDEFNRVTVSQMDFAPDQQAYERAIHFWESYVEGKDPEAYTPIFKPSYYINLYGTKEAFANYSAETQRPFAFVTPEGEWVESGRMGWFGISDDTPEGNETYNKAWQRAVEAYQDMYLVYLDCHI